MDPMETATATWKALYQNSFSDSVEEVPYADGGCAVESAV